VPIGSTVTLTATPTAGAVFQGWFGDCSGDQTTCTFTQNAAANVGATFLTAHHNYVFVTSATFDGNLGGVAGGDSKCQAAATGAGLGGTWRAWLATSTATAQSRLGSARGWVRRDGQPFADAAASIVAPAYQVFHPVRLDERGKDLSSETSVHSGTDQTGAAYFANSKYWTCVDWTSNATTDSAESGDILGGSGSWSYDAALGCNYAIPIYCFQTDYTAPLTFTKASGRVAFLSQGLFDPSTGLAAADSLCQGEATTASLSGTYKALLSTTTASAASRFSTTGAPWVRVDGVALSDTAASFFKPNPLAPLNQYANGTYVWDQTVWTGNTDPLSPGSHTCKDWTSKLGTDAGNEGDASYASQVSMFGTYGQSCNNTEHLYCLQQ
jgi:trimeric autotransporter adhesin